MKTSIWNNRAFEYAREVQLNEYLDQYDHGVEYFVKCKACSSMAHYQYITTSRGYNICKECIETQMEDEKCSREQAVESLTVLCDTIFHWFTLPKQWKTSLLDEIDKTYVIPEALRFLNTNCPNDYYLEDISVCDTAEDYENLRYHFSWKKMKPN